MYSIRQQRNSKTVLLRLARLARLYILPSIPLQLLHKAFLMLPLRWSWSRQATTCFRFTPHNAQHWFCSLMSISLNSEISDCFSLRTGKPITHNLFRRKWCLSSFSVLALSLFSCINEILNALSICIKFPMSQMCWLNASVPSKSNSTRSWLNPESSKACSDVANIS